MYLYIFALMFVGQALADVGTSRNQYLPPTQNGYNYDKPQSPFPTRPIPSQVPFPTQPQPPRPYNPPAEDHHHHEPGMPFDFQYSVNDAQTANDYSHKAQSDGDVVRGEYRTAMPDGRVQVVRYTADWKNGYNAEVTYEGTPTYPSGPSGFGAPPQQQQQAHQGYRY